jgi:hypothetical protein
MPKEKKDELKQWLAITSPSPLPHRAIENGSLMDRSR